MCKFLSNLDNNDFLKMSKDFTY